MVAVDVGLIQVVEDDAALLRTMARTLKAFRPCIPCSSAPAALAAIESEPRICGAVIDVGLGEGPNGFDVLAALQEKHGALPALVVTGDITAETVNRAFDLNARCVAKDDRRLGQRLRAFGVECMIADFEPDVALREALARRAARDELTEAEIEVLHAALYGRYAEWFEAHRGMPESTYRARVRGLLRKTGCPNVQEVAREVLWDALKR
ncbi:MAG: hypothetical protein HYV09_16330 [Deltaproteobacteria bacterium]|nr:hypothetical protein [Deltaproteobacteria bacterium]